ncbi:MAG: hypothetical protein ACOCRK_07225 [bacterium]
MKNSSIGNLMDYEYSKEEHFNNLMIYGMMSGKIKKYYKQKEMSIKEYVEGIISLYLLIEKYIESGIKDIARTLRDIIVKSYIVLINIFPDKTFDSITKELIDLYERKNWDYQNAAENQLRWSGAISFKTTLEHKIARIKSYYDGIKFKIDDEKIWDTIGDLINYCMIYTIWVVKEFPRNREVNLKYKMV